MFAQFLFLVVSLLAVRGSKFHRHGHTTQHGNEPIHKEDIMINSSLINVNTRGMGYYYLSFFQSTDCSDTPTYQEGYQTGKCLRLASPRTAGSIRMDCSATLDGVQVQYFSSSRTCTGVPLFPIIPSYPILPPPPLKHTQTSPYFPTYHIHHHTHHTL